MTKYNIVVFFLIFFSPNELISQNFSRQDTLRGSITPERAWWDLKYYHLDIAVDPADSTIRGKNTVLYKVLKESAVMQIDLQEPLVLEKVLQDGISLSFSRDGNVWWIQMSEKQQPGSLKSVTLFYGGKPRVAARPPWDGGISWKKDSSGKPFIASSCQGDGASLWWPCKDHMYDEPDSMMISVTVPGDLTDVSNGRLRSVITNQGNTRTFNWFVSNPISNYAVNINVADYAHFSEVYQGEKGSLDCDYYILEENLHKARKQFSQVPLMLKAFEYWFGPYPFYEDGYKLVEAPYLGMEHQSSVTYGNGYENGYRGMDLSGTGWGMKFDFIIIHESGHEWFGNNITYEDIADMWLHESFANYSESLYLEYYNGIEAGRDYILGCRLNVANERPVQGIKNVNFPGSQDMYFKGGNMLHTIRQIINDDEKWRNLLRSMNRDFHNKVVSGAAIEDYISEKAGIDLSTVFDQYLRDTRIPVLEYYISEGKLFFRWINCVAGFRMPLKISVSGKENVIFPTTFFDSVFIDSTDPEIKIDPGFYVGSMNMTGK